MSHWSLTFKPNAMHAFSAQVPKSDLPKVLRALDALTDDPTPNGVSQRKLAGSDGVFRCKVHGYRVLYCFDDTHISVLDIRMRDGATYRQVPSKELLGDGPDAELPPAHTKSGPASDSAIAADSVPGNSGRAASANTASPVTGHLTAEVLTALGVPDAHHAAVLRCRTEDDVLGLTVLPDALHLHVVSAFCERPTAEVRTEPDLLIGSTGDLLRYREGELVGFLLRLSPEQERYVTWAVNAKGPTLLKGGPGTGKSTVALHRTRVFLDALEREHVDVDPDTGASTDEEDGRRSPRLLFTTYTRALTSASAQLLQELLGERARHIEVATADSIAVRLYRGALGGGVDGGKVDIADARTVRACVRDAMKAAVFEGNALQQAAQEKTLQRLGADYLAEEISSVIGARMLTEFDAYAEAARPGRQVPLRKTQRAAVWAVYQAYVRQLERRGKVSWEQVRAKAAQVTEVTEVTEVAEAGGALALEAYDAVLVDEAQDLSAASLRMLVGLCKRPSRLFLTADANQSIYGAGFRWGDVHASLRFKGRTGVLRANYRSTRENGQAAESYLAAAGALDALDAMDAMDAMDASLGSEAVDGGRASSADTRRGAGTKRAGSRSAGKKQAQRFLHSGPLPVVRTVAEADEVDLVARFIRAATRSLRLGLGSAAVLCPTRRQVARLSEALTALGLQAEACDGKDLRLSTRGIKVLTLKSAKGLEFPVVCIAGLGDEGYPPLYGCADDDQRRERLERERRTFFVAMTRAMRSLLVALPDGRESRLYDGFDETLWNMGDR